MSPEKLGQHFLTGADWREKILASICPPAKSVWLEIGAGHGEMTALLARRVRRVVATELDASLAERLREVTMALGNAEIVSGDVLALDLPAIAKADRFHVYGNLPYYITSPILHRLFDSAERIEAIHVVIQMEVAERLTARPGSRAYGYLSVLAQYHSRPEIRLRIPPGAFRPRPKVFSALVSLSLPGGGAGLGIEDTGAFFDCVKVCFAQKRKTLWNNLRPAFGEARARMILDAAGIEPRERAERLSLAQFAAVFRAAQATAVSGARK
ncbi:MAG TPA: 16S rRNA (adenine(1518)-N(6)/adenine(1519)-N(6))-dimethyltransferase RsmA [Methylomirabilota bacterium]|nr:16S rRNA (adenine(1518)-N(6)/adenine(1519)-N(6))-dimethyltransferase RsmA [Methylomirabilota bacterium]